MRNLSASRRRPALLSFLLATAWLSAFYALPQLYGVNYSLRIGADWTTGADRCKSYDRVIQDLTQLKQVTENVRVFSLQDCDTAAMLLNVTQQIGMGLWLGIWVGVDQLYFNDERTRLSQLIGQYDFQNILGMHVSSEAVYRGDITADEAIALRNIIKADMDGAGLSNIPITIAEVGDIFIRFPELITVDPLAITANQFPFWDKGSDINGGATFSSAAENFNRFSFVEEGVGSRQIIITETGWADDGVNDAANEANSNSMAKWMRDFICLADRKGWQYFWFNAYDSDWRRVNDNKPNDVEGHFGIFDELGNMKPHIRDLIIDCSQDYWLVDPLNGTAYLPGNTTTSVPVASTPTTSTLLPSTAPTTSTTVMDTSAAPTIPIPANLPPSTLPTQTQEPTPVLSIDPPMREPIAQGEIVFTQVSNSSGGSGIQFSRALVIRSTMFLFAMYFCFGAG